LRVGASRYGFDVKRPRKDTDTDRLSILKPQYKGVGRDIVQSSSARTTAQDPFQLFAYRERKTFSATIKPRGVVVVGGQPADVGCVFNIHFR
jgi:hypothetical protein